MKNYLLAAVHVLCALILLSAACSDTGKPNLKGKWHATKSKSSLEITSNKFIITDDSPVAEDYFLKDDTLFTSFEGAQPYSRFVIQHIDKHYLKLLYPDSVSVEFTR